MDKLTWPDLIVCYDQIQFLANNEGVLTISSDAILKIITHLERDQLDAEACDLYALDDLDNARIGSKVKVHVGPPILSIGRLADTLDALLTGPQAYIEFPDRFYVVEGRLSERDLLHHSLREYKAVVSLLSLLAETATFLDQTDQTLFYFKDGKIEVPVRYNAAILGGVGVKGIETLLDHFGANALHRDQKLAILAEAISTIVRSQSERVRFEIILRNLDFLGSSVQDGYRLFVSSFSYDKIRSDIESANLDFISKIHKTFVDIQGQLLGVPIAAVVVASQLKPAEKCGSEVLTNVSVIAGAWIFVLFLAASILNQFLTLSAVSTEIHRQKERIQGDFAAVSEKFIGIFISLERRVFWYRVMFVIVGLIGVSGAILATLAFNSFTNVNLAACVK